MSRRDVSRRQAQRMWEEATPVQVIRRRGELSAVLSVRLPRQVLKDLTLAARRQGKGPGTLARELVEQGLALQLSPSPALIARVLTRFLESAPELERPWHWTPVSQPPIRYPVGRPFGPSTTASASDASVSAANP